MPAYNVSRFIGDAIESVLVQTHGDWTLHVVDDGSTDDTAAVAARFDDPRIRVVRQVNRGVSAARNRGLASCDGEAVMFLDGDDWLAPDALARLAAALEAEPQAVAAYGGFCFVSEDGARRLEGKTGPFPHGDILERLLVQNLFANGGHVLVRAAAVRKLVGFRSDIRYGEDWEFWCRLAAIGPLAVVKGSDPLLFVRRRDGSAILRMASQPAAFQPCMDAIFAEPALRARFGEARLKHLRGQAEAENRWIIGRELVRHGRRAEGLRWLRRSVLHRPGFKRTLLLAAAHALPLLPARLRGPFRSYRSALTPAARVG
ncbi:MAG TPA: glycosyltransferase family A protein [Acetobacteraceae bacterium]|nr:glycosyltransferase family A protein [Acetobacteraceae bacterium]